MRLVSRIIPLAALFHPLHAQFMCFWASPLALEATCNKASVSAIHAITPIVDCNAALQCSDTVKNGETIAWQCTAEVSCCNRAVMSEKHHEGNSSTDAAGDWATKCSLQSLAANGGQNKADSRWSTAFQGWPVASQNSTVVEKAQPTAHSWHPSSGSLSLLSKSTIRPRPIRTPLPTHDPKITSSATAINGPLTTTMTLVSTITVFLALAA